MSVYMRSVKFISVESKIDESSSNKSVIYYLPFRVKAIEKRKTITSSSSNYRLNCRINWAF